MGTHHAQKNRHKPNKKASHERRKAKRKLHKGLRADPRTGYKGVGR